MNINLGLEMLYSELFDRAKKIVFRTEYFRNESVAHDIAVDFIYSDTFKLFDPIKGNLEQFFVAYAKAWVQYKTKNIDRERRKFYFGNDILTQTFDIYYDGSEQAIDAHLTLANYRKLLSATNFKGVNLGIFLDLLIESTETINLHWSNNSRINLMWCGQQLKKNRREVHSIYKRMTQLVKSYEHI